MMVMLDASVVSVANATIGRDLHASLGCGLSGSTGELISLRVVQGLGGALMLPQTLATLRANFPARKLQLAVGVWAGCSALAIASGPVIGGLLVQYENWQSIFYINLAIGALAVAGAVAFAPESRDRRTQGLDFAGAGLLAGALFCLIWALIKTGSHPRGSAYTLSFLIADGVLAALRAGRLATAGRPLRPLSLFRIAALDAGR